MTVVRHKGCPFCDGLRDKKVIEGVLVKHWQSAEAEKVGRVDRQ